MGLIVYVLLTAKIPHWAITSLIVVGAVGFGLFAFAFASARQHQQSVIDEVGPLRRLVTMARFGLGVLKRPGPAAVAAFFQCLGGSASSSRSTRRCAPSTSTRRCRPRVSCSC